MGKVFEKLIKTIEDKSKKQINALESLKPKWQTKAIKYDDDESLEQKEESYNKLFDEKRDDIQELSREIYYKNLNYNFTSKARGSINFIKFKGPFSLFKKIRDRDISTEMGEEDQEKFKRKFGQIKLGNPKHKSEIQLYTIRNVRNLYDSREKIIDLFNNDPNIKSESIYRSKQGKTKRAGLKILTPKQMLQRLTALAQVKAGNSLESLLHEIRQIFYSLYESKQVTKKVYTNI